MKRVTLITVILAVIVALESWGMAWLKGYSEELYGTLNTLSAEAENSPDNALRQLETLEARWKEKRRGFGVYVHEAAMNEFEMDLAEARVRLERDDEEAAILLRVAAEAAAAIWERERPTLPNIL